MNGREKVIKGLEGVLYWLSEGEDRKCVAAYRAVEDALELLEEQEPKPVVLYGEDECRGIVCACPDCKAEWMGDKPDTHFCPNCGRKVKWDAAD